MVAGEQKAGVRHDAGPPSLLVLGVGNILLQDEGLGVRAVEAMQNISLPEGVELFDGATAGADLVDALADRRKVIVIDAVQADVEPGTIMRFTADDFACRNPITMSLHQLGFLDALIMARHLGCAPAEVIVIGVKPRLLGHGLELSREVSEAIPKVIELVLAELEGAG